MNLVDVIDMDIESDAKKNPIGTFKKPLTTSTNGPSSLTLNTPVSPKIPEPSILHPTNIKGNQQTKNLKLSHVLPYLLEKTQTLTKH